MSDEKLSNKPKNASENKELNRIEKQAKKAILESSPVRISMNMTGKCNIRCVYCHLTYAKYFTKDELDTDDIGKLDEFLPNLSHLVYFSSTEPLSATHFKDIFKETAPYNAEKYLSTNALEMDEEIAKMFVEGELYYLTISVAGLSHETFEKAHQVNQLDKLITNVETLNRLKKEKGTEFPKCRLVFVTYKENAHELPEAVKFAHKHNFSEGIKITYLKAYTDDLIEQIPFDHIDETNHWVREAQKLGKELNIPVTFDGGNFDDFEETYKVEGFHRPCMEPFERFHIEANGKVRTCCATTNTTFAGDLNTQSAWEIWNGEVYQDYRRRVNTDDPPDSCKRCTNNFRKDFMRRDVWDQRDMDLGIYERFKDGKNLLKSRQRRSK